jgi:20S proteasome alpha/beta subunit
MCYIFLLILFCRLTDLERTPAMLAFAGEEEDAPLLRWRVQVEINEHQRICGFQTPMSPEYVALKVADAQKLTCKFHRIPYALFTLIVGLDPYTRQPGLFATDPGGRVGKFGAYAIGRDLDLMNEFLRKYYKEEFSVAEALALAIAALHEVNFSLSFFFFFLIFLG